MDSTRSLNSGRDNLGPINREEVMTRFYVLEPALKGIGGHYYEYATDVLAAAARAGFATTLATHRQVDPATIAGLVASGVVSEEDVHPVFRYEHYVKPDEFAWLRAAMGILEGGARLASPLAALLQRLASGGSAAHTAPRPATETLSARRVSLALPRAPVWLAARLLAGLRVIHRRMRAAAAKACIAAVHGTKARQFRRDGERLFQRQPPQPGDVVFIPTLLWGEVDGLEQLLSRRRSVNSVHWHLMFRYHLFTGREPDYPAQLPALRGPQRLLRRLVARAGHGSVHFHTDTPELARQYETLQAGKFACLPIPHTKPGGAAARCERGPLRVVYLGDARAEKGYLELPRLVRALWPDYVAPQRIVFRVQSNFNIPGGEPGIAAARAELQSYPPEQVELLLQPLDSAAYRQLVQTGHISLVLYDPAVYYARSSGVLVESLSAGMPVLTLAGGWPAAQFAHAEREHQIGLRREATVLAHLGQLEKDTVTTASLRTAGRAGCWQMQHAVPAGAQAICVGLRAARVQLGQYVKLRLELNDARGRTVATRHALLGPLADTEQLLSILPIEPDAALARLLIWNALADRTIEFSSWSVDFLCWDGHAGHRFPRSVAGLACADPEDLPELLRELVEHYPHYHRTATRLADGLLRWHNPDRLVSELVKDQRTPQGVGNAALKDGRGTSCTAAGTSG